MRKFFAQPPDQQKDNKLVFEEIVVNLAHLEDEAGNYGIASRWLQTALKLSPNPAGLQKQIDAIQKKMAALLPVAPAKLY